MIHQSFYQINELLMALGNGFYHTHNGIQWHHFLTLTGQKGGRNEYRSKWRPKIRPFNKIIKRVIILEEICASVI